MIVSASYMYILCVSVNFASIVVQGSNSICKDGMGKKWPLHANWYAQNSALDVVICLYEPYQAFSSVFISNKTVNIAREHRCGTTLASQ